MPTPNMLNISFEFSQKLGVRELPKLDKNHQSVVRGMYIVGDLADAPIIKVALKQGYDVANHVASTLNSKGESPDPDHYDVVVIGAGPSGIGAALALQEHGLRYAVGPDGADRLWTTPGGDIGEAVLDIEAERDLWARGFHKASPAAWFDFTAHLSAQQAER